jgi:hypothetical protein
MIAAIAHDMNDPDNAPILELAETVADIGAGDTKGASDFVGRKWFFGKKKEGMNLGDRSIDPPAGAHFTPMKDEFLAVRRKLRHIYQSFLSRQKLEKYKAGIKNYFLLYCFKREG